eukprot:gene10221-11116_t
MTKEQKDAEIEDGKNNEGKEIEEKNDEENPEDELEGLNYEEWKGSEVMESLCPSCGGTGKTRFMFHKIPYFREIILASFFCAECGERNNEVTFGGQIQLHGCRYHLRVTSSGDTNRQIIKSDSASIIIPEIEFEIPAHTQKGEINTIEGVLKTAAKNLSFSQPLRRIETPEVAQKIDDIIDTLENYSEGKTLPYTIILDDPAGNSFIENPYVPKNDPHMTIQHYTRSVEQDAFLCIDTEKGVYKKEDGEDEAILESAARGEKTFGALPHNKEHEEKTSTIDDVDELTTSKAVTLPAVCPNCQHEGEEHTAITNIPHFKEVIIMSFTCLVCGFRTNEVKGGGSIPTYGTEVKLTVTSDADLKRDLLKSDTTMVHIPELDLELQVGTLGGMFTTVEGLLQKILKNLDENNSMVYGDSKTKNHSNDKSISDTRNKFNDFLKELSNYAFGRKFPFTLILRDPLGNSFISAPLGTFLPPEADKNLELKDYVRTHDENEDLGLNDINTKDFETGYDEELKDHGPILPDRVTIPYHKAVDHPTFFAKGTDINDNTVGGAVVAPVKSTSVPEVPAESEYFQPPAGWKFEKNMNELPDYSTRHHQHDKKESEDNNNDSKNNNNIDEEDRQTPRAPEKYGRDLGDDSHLDFIPREEFGGAKKGYIFRLGSLGMGYYEDRNATSHK